MTKNRVSTLVGGLMEIMQSEGQKEKILENVKSISVIYRIIIKDLTFVQLESQKRRSNTEHLFGE